MRDRPNRGSSHQVMPSRATMAPAPSSVTCVRLRTTSAAEGRVRVSTISAMAVAKDADSSVSPEP
jgi:hypothetical protein